MLEADAPYLNGAELYSKLFVIYKGLRGKWEGEKRKKWKAVIKIPRPDLTFRYSARFHV